MQPDLQHWFNSGSKFLFNNHAIFYKKEFNRKKQWILLIHGFPTASYDFLPIWPALARKYNLITADMLGFGFSAKPLPYEYTLSEQADILLALLKREKITTFHILAHDYGVSVAQELLARQGAMKKPVLSVCFLNGGLYPEFHKPLLIQKLMLTRLGPLLARFFNKGKLKASFDKIFGVQKPSETQLQDFWDLIAYNDGRQVTPALLNYMVERRTHRERWVSAMENAQIPVQMINGPMDPISGAHLAQAFAQRNPRASVVSLVNVGHYPQVEAPEKVADAYLNFLKRI